jgi:hypothetical protein
MTGVFNNEMDGSRARSGRTIEVRIHVPTYDLDTMSEKYITAEQWLLRLFLPQYFPRQSRHRLWQVNKGKSR